MLVRPRHLLWPASSPLSRVAALARLGAVGFACACGPAPAVVAPTAPDALPPDVALITPAGRPLALRRSALADQYFWLRAKALEGGDVGAAFNDAIAAVGEARRAFEDDPTAWEDLDVAVGEARTAHEFVVTVGELPAVRAEGGQRIPVRDVALRVARAIEGTEAAFRREVYPAHRALIDAAAKDLAARLISRAPPIVQALARETGLDADRHPVIVTLVAEAPYPTAFAADARGVAMASFVRVQGNDPNALVETVLQEAIHAIDEVSVREETGMNTLRRIVREGGVDRDDPNLELALTTLTFAEAASLVRRFVDPAHKPLGESGFYTLFAPAGEVVAAWEDHVQGGPLERVGERIARALRPPDGVEPPAP